MRGKATGDLFLALGIRGPATIGLRKHDPHTGSSSPSAAICHRSHQNTSRNVSPSGLRPVDHEGGTRYWDRSRATIIKRSGGDAPTVGHLPSPLESVSATPSFKGEAGSR